MKILIKNAKILTMNNDETILENHSILIKKNRIQKIYPSIIEDESTYNKVVDAKNNLVMPGLINMHTHIPMTLLRNYADDLNLEDWLFNKIFPIEDKMEDEDIFFGTLLGCLEMLKSGTTTFLDMYFKSEIIAKAVKKAKIRAYIGKGFVNNNIENRIKENIDFFKNFNNKNNNLIKTIIAPHSVYTNDKESLKISNKMAQDTTKMMTIHLSESLNEVNNCIKLTNKTPFEFSDESRLFENVNTIVAHAVHLNKNDIKIIKKNNISLVHNPSSNLKISSGIMNVQKLLNEGINVTLGTDGAASNNTLDMFKEMHLASLISKGVFNNPTNLKAYDVLKMATTNAAKALNRENDLGKIKENYLADLIIININNINHTPSSNLINSLVYSTNGNDVILTMVNGNILYENGYFKDINEKSIIKKCNFLYNKLIKK
ncbi:5-methylthioadenosine/S-adenosylhomocysteine deaminase [Mycoplasmopsis maculosa]|uniref:5-methylthioadenosine/S-adenosylhomocysteine deaminase n=1 Tax=Mycoplasmopsis maculosa TaxID=114885 RepID=A0A449B3D3_9BACT|nr:amidohydrolase [Mycoplasmopsis maculosa]VEU75100.1 5-methylthioadenosine/S-adenosylhomocysteine deaminase [Mycoplasmopsis maculosa]